MKMFVCSLTTIKANSSYVLNERTCIKDSDNDIITVGLLQWYSGTVVQVEANKIPAPGGVQV